MGTSQRQTITEGPLSAMTWELAGLTIRCSRCADPAVLVECTVSETVELVNAVTTRSVSRFTRHELGS